ncbi:MAG TPA: lipase family protein [Candidatus Angelobacter sp.]|nr:lipase family protein [Candidatus Angelobacter sp.]
MSQGVPYSPRKQDLFYPAKTLESFPTTRPKSDAELCAWMSLLAYCDVGTSFAFDRDKVAAHLGPLDFQPVKFAESADSTKKGGTHCFAAVHRDSLPENSLMVVAFRGTNKDDPRDVLDDMDAVLGAWRGPGRISAGFNTAFEEVAKEILAVVEAADCRLLFTGHSLGAALATILAAVKRPGALYTIGSPRCGDQAFADSLSDVQNFRYVDCCDVVTTLPPPLLGHVHAGVPRYIDRRRKIALNPGDEFISSDRLRAGISYFFRYAWKPGNVLARNLADHAPINYVTAIGAAQLSP